MMRTLVIYTTTLGRSDVFYRLLLLRGLLLIEASIGAFYLFGIQAETPRR